MDTRHHDCCAGIFARDVNSFVSVLEELGNPFKEESLDLLVLDTKEITNPSKGVRRRVVGV